MQKIAVEGLWQVGKSSALRTLNNLGYKNISEPDHTRDEKVREALAEGLKIDLDSWYWAAHCNNLLLLNESKSPVVMERTGASTLAFIECISGANQQNKTKIDAMISGQNIDEWRQVDAVVVLDVPQQAYLQHLFNLGNRELMAFATANPGFIEQYPHALLKYLTVLCGPGAVRTVPVLDAGGQFLPFAEINRNIQIILSGGDHA